MPELPKPGDLIGEKYEVVGVLGQGGMGAVFECVHRLTGKRFAIKWMLPSISDSADAIKRFIREAQVAGRVEHPNVVEVYDLGRQDGSCFMVMELLQGESLRDLLDRRHKLEPALVAQLLLPVLRGLATAHEAGVIHRDLKPENIFLAKDPERGVTPKVLDFGISKLSSPGGQVTVGLTRHGQVMGTPHYMPPEQLRGEKVDHRVDLYAVGVIMYQALAGQLPFRNENFSELVIEIATTSPKPLAEAIGGLPPGFCDLVQRAMARDPDQRFQSSAELAAALEPYAGGAQPVPSAFPGATPSGGFDTVALPVSTGAPISETPLAAESTWRERPQRPRTPWLLMGAVGVLAVAVIGLLISLLMRPEEESWATAAAGEPTVETSAAASGAAPQDEATDDGEELIPLDLEADAPRPSDPQPYEATQAAPSPAASDNVPDSVREAEEADDPAVERPGRRPPSASDRSAARAAEERRERARQRRERAARREELRTRQPPSAIPAPPPPTATSSATSPAPVEASKPAAKTTRGRTGAQLDVNDF